jgi:hypothetical protein
LLTGNKSWGSFLHDSRRYVGFVKQLQLSATRLLALCQLHGKDPTYRGGERESSRYMERETTQ